MDASIRFWQPTPHGPAELLCEELQAHGSALHVHEEWQFAVLDAPSRLSRGAFRRDGAGPEDVTVVAPYHVHSEGVEVRPAAKWLILYTTSAVVRRAYGGRTPRFQGAVVGDRDAAAELGEVLRGSSAGTLTGDEFTSRLDRWLQRFVSRHAQDAPVVTPDGSVGRARSYLEDRPTRSVTLPELGEAAGVTTSHLVRSFSRAVGLPPRNYHAAVRLAHARRLLAEGKSATWVAYECGFADQSHLSRRFREQYGITPGAFQEQSRRAAAMVVESTQAWFSPVHSTAA